MNEIQNVPMRRCCGCMKSFPKTELIKIGGRDGYACIDIADREKGRGVYVCKNLTCIEKAEQRRAIGRNLHTNIPADMLADIFEELRTMVNADK